MSLPVCPDVSATWSTATETQCRVDTGFIFSFSSPTSQRLVEVCGDAACMEIINSLRTRNPYECVEKDGATAGLYATLITPLDKTCAALASATAPATTTAAPQAPQASPTSTTAPNPATTTPPATTKALPSTNPPTSAGSSSAAADTTSPTPTPTDTHRIPTRLQHPRLPPTPLPLTASSESSVSVDESSREGTARPGRVSTGSLSGPDAVINTQSQSSSSSLTIPIISIVGAVIAFILAAWWWKKKRLRQSDPKSLRNEDLESTREEGYTAVDDEYDGDNALLPLVKSLEPWRISVTDIDEVSLIGSGSYGAVFLVKLERTRELASKRVGASQCTSKRIESMIEEAKIAASLHHRSIIDFVGIAWTTPYDLQILFEYMPNGDLRQYLDDHALSNARWNAMKLRIALQIVEGLAYVHSFDPPIVHRDLKARNVLLDAEMNAKIGDFGVSRAMSENATMTTGIGTSRWLAPEVIRGGGHYTEACDVYSFGVMLVEMDTHKVPFTEIDGNVSEVTLLGDVALGLSRPQLSASCDPRIAALVARCLEHEPSKRANALELAFTMRQIKREVDGTAS